MNLYLYKSFSLLVNLSTFSYLAYCKRLICLVVSSSFLFLIFLSFLAYFIYSMALYFSSSNFFLIFFAAVYFSSKPLQISWRFDLVSLCFAFILSTSSSCSTSMFVNLFSYYALKFYAVVLLSSNSSWTLFKFNLNSASNFSMDSLLFCFNYSILFS